MVKTVFSKNIGLKFAYVAKVFHHLLALMVCLMMKKEPHKFKEFSLLPLCLKKMTKPAGNPAIRKQDEILTPFLPIQST